LKVVVDANVCVSAVLSGKGNPARILDHALRDGPYDFELCAPPQLFSKLQEVLVRPKIAGRLGLDSGEIEVYARRLRLAVEEVSLGDVRTSRATPPTPKTTRMSTPPFSRELPTS
jgi:uncharacterized protein